MRLKEAWMTIWLKRSIHKGIVVIIIIIRHSAWKQNDNSKKYQQDDWISLLSFHSAKVEAIFLFWSIHLPLVVLQHSLFFLFLFGSSGCFCGKNDAQKETTSLFDCLWLVGVLTAWCCMRDRTRQSSLLWKIPTDAVDLVKWDSLVIRLIRGIHTAVAPKIKKNI